MNNNPILFIDSGIGGLPYCMDFLNKNPYETVYYLADNKNFPYGPKSKEELILILTALVQKIIVPVEPKIIVLACNTATIAALAELRNKFGHIPFVGTVPAVKPAAEACNFGKIGVLGTDRTVEEIHNLNLTEKTCEITGIAAPELVDFIELRYDDSKDKEKAEIVKKYIDRFKKEKVDTLVLGCTHFLFLQEEFRREAAPFFKVFDSLEGISKRIEFLLDDKNLRAADRAAESRPLQQNRLLLTGSKNISGFWQKWAQNSGFKLETMDL